MGMDLEYGCFMKFSFIGVFLFGMYCNPSQQQKIQRRIWWSNLGRLGGGGDGGISSIC